jgi:acetate---CoA ligase (ADP-forming)
VLAEEASVRNPVDMIASATPESYRLVLDRVLADEGIDAAIAAFVPPLGVRQEDVAQAIVDAKEGHHKPVLAVLMGRQGLPQGRAQLHEAGVPGYIFPESAAKALAAMYRYRQWLEQPEGTFREFEVDRDEVRGSWMRRRRGETTWRGRTRWRCSGRTGSRCWSPGSWASARRRPAADELGYPVVMKIESPDVVHKTDVGGVVVNLKTDEEVRVEYDAMVAGSGTRCRMPTSRACCSSRSSGAAVRRSWAGPRTRPSARSSCSAWAGCTWRRSRTWSSGSTR